MLRTLALAVVILVVLVVVGWAGWSWSLQRNPTLIGSRLDPQNFTQIQQGRYLTLAGDCESCHDNQQTKEPFAGGRAIETPCGNVLAANITPDRDTGIGTRSDADFVRALRDGRSLHGSFLYPAMPYPYYTKLTEADALAIRAYLNTVKPVHHDVVSNQLPFPFNIRQIMTVWNALYFKRGEYVPDLTKPSVWNRGAYLVLGPGHCAACHTPKNFLGGDDASHELEGYRLQGWFAPNITGDPVNGIGGLSLEDIASYLK